MNCSSQFTPPCTAQFALSSEGVLKRAFGCLCVSLAIAACDQDAPQPPRTTPPGNVKQITGNERIAWQQTAATAAELSTFRFIIYVDRVATEMQDVSCGSVAASGSFPCSGALPSMEPGLHVLEITAFIDADSRLESARSATVMVTK